MDNFSSVASGDGVLSIWCQTADEISSKLF